MATPEVAVRELRESATSEELSGSLVRSRFRYTIGEYEQKVGGREPESPTAVLLPLVDA